MPTTKRTDDACIVVPLTAREANAAVYSVTCELANAGEELGRCEISTVPGAMMQYRSITEQIRRLAAIGDQLLWCAHWGRVSDDEPPAITADKAVMLELCGLLQSQVGDDEFDDTKGFEFDKAARTIARAFADAA